MNGAKRVSGEYRGIRYSIGPRAPYSGVGWILHVGDGWRGRDEQSSGAFYEGCPEHPEGAYVWAETCVKRRIDRLLATVAEFDAEVARRAWLRSFRNTLRRA